ncbi:MAG: hypothetical protein F6K19_39815 [Cyanothece sp. SIO1E1]|nr:hypothetical protein [Cyanothece sp. SIO1E1]
MTENLQASYQRQPLEVGVSAADQLIHCGVDPELAHQAAAILDADIPSVERTPAQAAIIFQTWQQIRANGGVSA